MFSFTRAFAIVPAVFLASALARVAAAQVAPGSPPASAGGASASTAQARKDTGSASSKPTKGSRSSPPKVEELDALVIEGRIQKPEVFYVIGRAQAAQRDEKLRKSFVKEIVDSVKDNPF